MSRATRWLLSAGVLIFIVVLGSQGLPTVLSMLALAGWGLVPVALFHVVPLVLDAAAIRVLFEPAAARRPMRWALLARWVGESAASLMPAGQLGGPVLMARHLRRLGMSTRDAAAAITVSTTLQSFAQIGFALLGVSLLGAHTGRLSEPGLRTGVLIASAFLGLQVAGFYMAQRRGLFGRVMRTAARLFGRRDWSVWMVHAEAIDAAVDRTYGRAGPVAASFALNLAGWVAGTVEVWWVLQLIGLPADWSDSLMLESVGQAIRGAAFAIPGALGVQEGGYVLLASLVGLPSDAGLALSLAKRAREIIMGLPGLFYLHQSERAGAGVAQETVPVPDITKDLS
jgi:putative membrane protein